MHYDNLAGNSNGWYLRAVVEEVWKMGVVDFYDIGRYYLHSLNTPASYLLFTGKLKYENIIPKTVVGKFTEHENQITYAQGNV